MEHPSTPRALAHVDLAAITANVRTLHALAGVPVMSVIKADAYGHGLIPVARAAIAGGSSWLGMALLEEALALRSAGLRDAGLRDAGLRDVRLLAWLTPPSDRFAEAIQHDIDLSVASVAGVVEIAAAAKAVGRTARVHLEVDTGMTRGGVRHELEAVLAALVNAVAAGDLHLVGIWSHLANADRPAAPSNARQRAAFESAIARAMDLGLQPEIRHLANSAATLTAPELRYDLVRCGIGIYGLSPDLELMGPAEQWGLRPAMQVTARLSLVKDVEAGAELSYGGSYVMPAAGKVAIVPVGYGDGIPRSGHLEVASAEGRHPVRGRVCMDQVIIECAPDSQLAAGDEVVLFGPDGPSADDWGRWAGTIGYEIVTRLGPRIERRYHPQPLT